MLASAMAVQVLAVPLLVLALAVVAASQCSSVDTTCTGYQLFLTKHVIQCGEVFQSHSHFPITTATLKLFFNFNSIVTAIFACVECSLYVDDYLICYRSKHIHIIGRHPLSFCYWQRLEFFTHMLCHSVRTAAYSCPYCNFRADLPERLSTHISLHFNLPGRIRGAKLASAYAYTCIGCFKKVASPPKKIFFWTFLLRLSLWNCKSCISLQNSTTFHMHNILQWLLRACPLVEKQ